MKRLARGRAGCAFYSKGDKQRVIDISPGYQMVSLDAETGIPDAAFGENGIVDLYQGLRNADDPRYPYPDIGISAPPFVMNDVIVVGAAHRTGGRPDQSSIPKGISAALTFIPASCSGRFHDPGSGRIRL